MYFLFYGLIIAVALVFPIFSPLTNTPFRPAFFIVLEILLILLLPMFSIIRRIFGREKGWDKKVIPVQWLLFTEEDNKERGLGKLYNLHPKMVSAGLIVVAFGLFGLGTTSLTMYPCGWGDVITRYSGCTQEVQIYGRSIAVSPDGAVVAVGGDKDNPLILLNADGSNKRELKGHTSFVNVVTFSPDSKVLVSGSSDNTFKVWRVGDGALLHNLNIDTNNTTTMNAEFSLDGTLLATYTRGNKLQLWRVADWSELDEFPAGYQFSVESATGTLIINNKAEWSKIKDLANLNKRAVISPDGSLLAYGNPQNGAEVLVKRLSDNTTLYNLRAESNLIAFSPDGKYLFAVSSNIGSVLKVNAPYALRMWSVADGRVIKDFAPETSNIEAIAFSHDGKTVISASFNHVSFWRI